MPVGIGVLSVDTPLGCAASHASKSVRDVKADSMKLGTQLVTQLVAAPAPAGAFGLKRAQGMLVNTFNANNKNTRGIIHIS